MKTQRNILLAISIILAFLLTYEACRKMPAPCPEIIASVTKKDTVIGGSDRSHVVIAKNDSLVHHSVNAKIKTKTATFTLIPGIIDLISETKESLNGSADDFAITPEDPIFEDTLHLNKGKDSFGYVALKDTFRDGKLFRSFSFEIYKTTITNNLQVKPHNKYYWGIEAIGNQNIPVQYLGVNLAAQGKKKGRIITIGAGLMNKENYYKAGILFPLNK